MITVAAPTLAVVNVNLATAVVHFVAEMIVGVFAVVAPSNAGAVVVNVVSVFYLLLISLLL